MHANIEKAAGQWRVPIPVLGAMTTTLTTGAEAATKAGLAKALRPGLHCYQDLVEARS